MQQCIHHVYIVQAVRKVGTTPELHSLRKSIPIIGIVDNLCELYTYIKL